MIKRIALTLGAILAFAGTCLGPAALLMLDSDVSAGEAYGIAVPLTGMAAVVVAVVEILGNAIRAWWRWVEGGRKVDMPEGPNYGKMSLPEE